LDGKGRGLTLFGSNAEQATASVPTEAVVVAQPARISSGIGNSAARVARLADEIERMSGGLREGFGPAGAFRLPIAPAPSPLPWGSRTGDKLGF